MKKIYRDIPKNPVTNGNGYTADRVDGIPFVEAVLLVQRLRWALGFDPMPALAPLWSEQRKPGEIFVKKGA